MDLEHVQQVLQQAGAGAPALEDKLALLEHMRGKLRGPARRNIDQMLLELYQAQRTRHEAQRAQNAQFRELIGEMQEHIETLTGPPWYPATFLCTHETARGILAEVVHGGGRQLLAVGDDVEAGELAPGDEVYLNAERAAIVGQAPGGGQHLGEVAGVERLLPDGRLVIRVRDTDTVITAAASLGPVKEGDVVRWLSFAGLAVEVMPPNEGLRVTPEIGASVPAQVVGVDTETLVARVTAGIVNPKAAQRYGLGKNRTVLMWGPAGCGKTATMRLIAQRLTELTGQRCRVDVINGAELESPYVGETQQNIKRVFREANEHDGPAIIFLDEAEAVGRIRGSHSGHRSDKFLVTFMTELEGLAPRRQVAVIAATNRKDLLDPAFLERLSALELHVPRPRQEAARAIFNLHLSEDLPYRPNGSQAPGTRQALVDLAVARLFYPNADNEIARIRFRDGTARVVAARELISGRLIEQICIAAREQAFLRDVRSGPPGLCAEDMEHSLSSALARLRTELSIYNVRSHLDDLAADADVIAVDPVRPKVEQRRGGLSGAPV